MALSPEAAEILRELVLRRKAWEKQESRYADYQFPPPLQRQSAPVDPPDPWESIAEPPLTAALGSPVKLQDTVVVRQFSWRTYLFVTDEHLILVPVKPRAWHAPAPEVVPRTSIAGAFVGRSGFDLDWWFSAATRQRPTPTWFAVLVLRDDRRLVVSEADWHRFLEQQDAEVFLQRIGELPGSAPDARRP